MGSLSNLPTLTTGTSASTGDSSAQSTGQTTAQTTDATTTSNAQSTSTTGDAASITAPSLLTGTSASAFHLTGLPTIEGAGIPTLVIPYTANAPFMQKSTLPEGTVFIAVGAVLAFIGACILLRRGLVAWSINRSVKRAALASVRGGSEKNGSHWGSSNNGGYSSVPKRSSFYKDLDGYGGSSMSLDQLTSAGKPVKPHFRDSTIERTTTPPANLFFSPTAHAATNRDSAALSHRNSGYMPSGFYASPNSQAANGQINTTIGGAGAGVNLAPYAQRASHISNSSPPTSPGLPPQSRSSAGYRGSTQSREGLQRAPPSRDGLRASSRDGLRASSRDGLRASDSREGARSNRNSYFDPRGSGVFAQPSSSSLMVGYQSTSDLAGSRAPSAYLEDLFENHGNGPRERF